jgi:outer membrane protein OmpA-like peptidoglycan-associated protein
MKSIIYYAILAFVFGFQHISAQVDFITPPAVKTVTYADREVTFSNVTMNGQETTYLAVEKGATVKIKTRIVSKQIGNYCPACIVQIYWGINNYTSVCAKSFYGYNAKKKKSKHTFTAPMKEGFYYITMGGSLEYSCKNNSLRPRCESEYAFAVIKVGNPDPEKKITLEKVKRGAREFLKTTLIKPGSFGNLNKLEWFFEDEKLAYDGKTEIPLTKFGSYKALWSNCLTSVADSVNYTVNGVEEIPTDVIPEIVPEPILIEEEEEEEEEEEAEEEILDSNDITVLIANNDAFVLEHLNFDLNKYDVQPEGQEDLNKLAEIMKNNPSMVILLEGHTAIGNARRNRILSEKRVKSTKEYLVSQGVDSSKIETIGWGQQKPLVYTKNKERGKINRRVEIQILSR